MKRRGCGTDFKFVKHKRDSNWAKQATNIINSAKDVPCADCGCKYPFYVMDFDHRDPGTKCFDLSDATRVAGLRRIIEEIDKCDVVCANCHRIRTFKRAKT